MTKLGWAFKIKVYAPHISYLKRQLQITILTQIC